MDLLILFGPAASGKMSVGRRIADRTRYRLFHNHMTIEPLIGLWDFSHPAFQRISSELRRSIVREAVAGDEFDLVFTFVWALDDDRDAAFLDSLAKPVRDAGGTVRHAELVCSQAERLRRNRGDERLDHKRSKRDLDWSDGNLRDMDSKYRLASRSGEMEQRVDHYVRIDNEGATPEQAAEQIIAAFDLPET